jgi:hypothetical protein
MTRVKVKIFKMEKNSYIPTVLSIEDCNFTITSNLFLGMCKFQPLYPPVISLLDFTLQKNACIS